MPITNIRDLVQVEPWRAKFLPARFGDALFHVEAGSRESGRRIVTHSFPKKDLPYSEDMGRRAIEFSVRGYCVQFVTDANALYTRDYTTPRDALVDRLETGGADTLQLPFQRPLTVVCTRYRMTEEERLGGYVAFDMTFVELGAPPFQTAVSSYQDLLAKSQGLRDTILASLAPQPSPVLPPIPL
jgi:prophage DNA circulation protein